MNEPLDDRELRAMLEARAGRMPASAPHEVMAGFRAGVREGRGGVATPVLPVGVAAGGLRLPAGWIAIGVAAVLALAVLGGRLDRAPLATAGASATGSPVPATASAEVTGSPGAMSPVPSAASPLPSERIVGQIGVQRFRQALASQEIDGMPVLLQGILERWAYPCPTGSAATCEPQVVFPGLEGVPVHWRGPATDVTNDPFAGQPAAWVVVPYAGTLELLGRLRGNASDPQPAFDPRQRYMSLATPFDLYPLAGWLVIGGIHSCPALGPGATPCPGPGPMLTDKEPMSDGIMTSDLQLQVVVATGRPPGIEPSRIVNPGPFLASTRSSAVCSGQAASDSQCASGRSIAWAILSGYLVDRLIQVNVP